MPVVLISTNLSFSTLALARGVCYIENNVLFKAFTSLVGALGSLVVSKDPKTDRRALNILPSLALFYGSTLLSCYAVHDEPFSVCVRNIISALG